MPDGEKIMVDAKKEHKLILVVEDNSDDERLTLRTLRRNNVMNEVVAACSGEAAMSFLEDCLSQQRPIPSLVIMDLRLPGLNGVELLRWIRSKIEFHSVPVVVFTTSTRPEDILECSRAGANSYVFKPQDPQEFSEALLNVSMYWLILHRSAAHGTSPAFA